MQTKMTRCDKPIKPLNVLCIAFLGRNLNSNNIFYHCMKEKHFVNLEPEPVITSYYLEMLKS